MENKFKFTAREIQESQMDPAPLVDTRIKGHTKLVDIILGCIITNSSDFDILGIGLVKMKGSPSVTRIQIHGDVVALIIGRTEHDLTKDWGSVKRGDVHKMINEMRAEGLSRAYIKGFEGGVTLRVSQARTRSVSSAVSVICKWNIANPELEISILSGQGGTIRVGTGTVLGRQTQADFSEDVMVRCISKSPDLIKKECELANVQASLVKVQNRANLLMNEIRDLKND